MLEIIYLKLLTSKLYHRSNKFFILWKSNYFKKVQLNIEFIEDEFHTEYGSIAILDFRIRLF
jgi:hypothetical protein